VATKIKSEETILEGMEIQSKLVTHWMAIGHLFTAKKVTELFLKEIVFFHGFFSSIVSYEDQIFTS
jgi:hypothetical protein